MNKKYIITKNEEIQEIIKIGKKISNKYFIIFFKENNYDFNRYSISISKKIGKANIRNKIKRQLKDILMKNKLLFKKDYVIIVRNNLLTLTYDMKQECLLNTLREEK